MDIGNARRAAAMLEVIDEYRIDAGWLDEYCEVDLVSLAGNELFMPKEVMQFWRDALRGYIARITADIEKL